MTHLALLRQLDRMRSLLRPTAFQFSVLAGALTIVLLTGCGIENQLPLGANLAVPSATVNSESSAPATAVPATLTPKVNDSPTPTEVATATPIPVATNVATQTPISTQPGDTKTPKATSAPVLTSTGPETTGLGPFPLPLRVRIPKIKVDASVETVGQDANGAMGTPHGSDQVAWYGLGPSPGQSGASVIAGHVDSVHGPAVFWSLQDLRPGDTIDVDVYGGTTRRFVVDRSDWYAPDAAPLPVIFAEGGTPRLNLITCGGVFDRTRHAYDRRLVVYTHLQTLSGVTG